MPSWQEDLVLLRRHLLDERDLDDYRKRRQLRIDQLPHWGAAEMLPETCTKILFVAGANEVREFLDPFADLPEQVTANYLGFQQHDHEISPALLKFTDLANIYLCVGRTLTQDLLGTLRPYLVRVMSDRNMPWAYWKRGFTALAVDDRLSWGPVAGLLQDDPIPPFQPGKTFQFNLQGLLRHLSAAIHERAPLVDVLPAWRDFLVVVPELKKTREIDVDWETCWWVARLVHHHIGGAPLATVGDFLYREIYAIAGLDP